LSNQAAAAGTEAEPNGDLAPARRGPAQQQAGDVGTGDQEHHPMTIMSTHSGFEYCWRS